MLLSARGHGIYFFVNEKPKGYRVGKWRVYRYRSRMKGGMAEQDTENPLTSHASYVLIHRGIDIHAIALHSIAHWLAFGSLARLHSYTVFSSGM